MTDAAPVQRILVVGPLPAQSRLAIYLQKTVANLMRNIQYFVLIISLTLRPIGERMRHLYPLGYNLMGWARAG